ncbi:unnamed protein product [Cochlearia groenlandica]
MREREEEDSDDEDAFMRKQRYIKDETANKLALESAFYMGIEFKVDVLDYALHEGLNLVQDRWDKKKLSYMWNEKERR